MRWARVVQSPLPLADTYDHAIADHHATVIGAFCTWACQLDQDHAAAAAAEAADFEQCADPSQLHHLATASISHLSSLSGTAHDEALLRARLGQLYEAFVSNVATEREEIARLYAGEERPTAPWQTRGRKLAGTTAPAADVAFVCGHGTYDAGEEQVVVPPGMTLHFISRFDEYALATNGMRAITQGGTGASVQKYTSGDRVPNYHLYPETYDCDVAANLQANVQDLPLYFIGDSEWDVGAPQSALCTAPRRCAASGEPGTHLCHGILRTLGRVKELFVLACRGRSDTAEDSGTTYRIPGEWLPLSYLGDRVDELRLGLLDGTGLTAALKELECEDPSRLARVSLHGDVRRSIVIPQGRDFLRREGRIAYLGMYLGQSDRERHELDSAPDLKHARRSAQATVDYFIAATSEARAALLEELIAEAGPPEKWGQLLNFLAYRVPGFWTWKRSPAVYHDILEGSRASVRWGGHYTGLFHQRLRAVLLSDAAGGFGAYAEETLQRFRPSAVTFDVRLVHGSPYLAAATLGPRPAPRQIQHALAELVRMVCGPGTTVRRHGDS